MENIRKIVRQTGKLPVKATKLVKKISYLLYREFIDLQPDAAFFAKLRPVMKEIQRAQKDISAYYARPEIQQRYIGLAKRGLELMKEDEREELQEYMRIFNVTEQDIIKQFEERVLNLSKVLAEPGRAKVQMRYHRKKRIDFEDGFYSIQSTSLGNVKYAYGEDKNYARINHNALNPYSIAVHELEHVAQRYLLGSEEVDNKIVGYGPYLRACSELFEDNVFPSIYRSNVASYKGNMLERVSEKIVESLEEIYTFDETQDEMYYMHNVEVLSRMMEIILVGNLTKNNQAEILDTGSIGVSGSDFTELRAYVELEPYILDKQAFVNLLNSFVPDTSLVVERVD